MTIIEIYQNALAQLNAQANQARDNAYVEKQIQLKAEYEAYKQELNAKLEGKIAELKASLSAKIEELNQGFLAAIKAREENDEKMANLYADSEKSLFAKEIANLEKKIEELKKQEK